jgi:LPXTG-motif cell wall-anchored protein
MNKVLKTILISSIAVFGIGFLFVNSTQARVIQFDSKQIFVDFDEPPFNLNNFVPGMSSLPKTITITNNEGFNINVHFKAKKTSEDDILADALIVTIDNKSNYLSYLFDNNISLTPVNSGKSQNYDIIIKFDENAGDEYQSKFINFDFIITVEEIGGGNGEILSVIISGGGYPGQYVTTTTIPGEVAGAATEQTTTTTIPGEVHGEATERESFEEGGEGGFFKTTTTTTLPGFVFGKSIIRVSSCPVNLTMTGINPLLASLLCLGQNACDACSNPLIILLLGIGIIIIALYLAAAKRLNNWIAFIIALAVIVYLLLFVFGICLSPWFIFIIGLLMIGGAVYLVYRRKK